MSQDSGVLLFVYADWCGHCQMMKPHWERAKKSMNLKNVIEVESSKIDEARKNKKISKVLDNLVGFPYLVYVKGDKVEEFNDERSESKILAFYNKFFGKKSASVKEEKKGGAWTKSSSASAKAMAKPKPVVRRPASVKPKPKAKASRSKKQ